MGDQIIKADRETLNRIRYARTSLGMSQVELAEQVGVNRWQVIQWEKGEQLPNKLSRWQKIAEVTRRPLSFYLDEYREPRGDIDPERIR